MKTGPLVSAIIPTFAGGEFLDSSIRSILSQTYPNIEVIVVDDGSVTGRAKAVCDAYAGKVRYIGQKNSGPSAARNTGIRESRGDYIAFNDDDDLWLPHKIEKQMARLLELEAAGARVGLVYTGIQFINEADERIGRMLYRSSGRNYRKLCYINFVGPSCSVIVTRRAVDDAGLFDEDIWGPQDYDLWIRIAEQYELYSIDEFLTCYRSKEGQLSKNPEIMTQGYERILKKILQTADTNGVDERSLTQCFNKSRALWWKNAAYDRLFVHGDGPGFRDHMKLGMTADPSLFGLKSKVDYGLSHLCPGGFKWLGPIKRFMRRDVIEDVATLRTEDLVE